MSAPPTSGPAIAPAENTVMLRACAAGICSSGSSFGRIDERTGWLTAKHACCRAKMPSSTHTFCRCRAAWAKNSPPVTISPTVVMISRVRRSR